ncbi:MAG: hypothetical protein GC157_04650 [Frankiales bacterium]|nr:hypothetical protein [Frankiales bacterium]
MEIQTHGHRWSLHDAFPEGPRFVAALTDAEVEELRRALALIAHLTYLSSWPLVLASADAVYAAIAKAAETTRGASPTAALIYPVNAAFIGWCLMFESTINHMLVDIKRRFGANSPEYLAVEAATNEAFDTHPGYRFAVNLRRAISHDRVPELGGKATAAVHSETGESRTSEWLITLSPEWFDRTRVSAKFRTDLDERLTNKEPFVIAEEVSDAMEGLHLVRVAYMTAYAREMTDASDLLEHLMDRVPTRRPVVIGAVPEGTGTRFEWVLTGEARAVIAQRPRTVAIDTPQPPA